MLEKIFSINKGLAVAALAVTVSSFVPAYAQDIRNVSEYNLEAGVGLKGFDPVSYFAEGDKIAAGSDSLDYRGVTYIFLSSTNKEKFNLNPSKYEPTYGGWCAFAMASGSQVDIDPAIYTINGNRIHYFVSKRAKELFDADIAGYEARADRFWKQISGESPRK
ncbi:MAG: hypothetical protein RJB13_2013 [Pseudomonadota bacterium]|jgi:YHS domain-containing protein